MTITPSTRDVLDPDVPEFERPPAEPMPLLEHWFAHAADHGVAEPDALALASVDGSGRPSSRMVKVLYRTTRGLVFTSHADSPKARDFTATGRVSAVLYWREIGRQVVVGGTIERLDADVADELWYARPAEARPMSVVARQSTPLTDEHALLDRARRLRHEDDGPLPPPASWAAFELVPDEIEFWHVGIERLHRRLRYHRRGVGWSAVRLQP